MSSLVRRMEIRAMKARGFHRTPFLIERGPDGAQRLRRVARGGLILDPNDQPIGTRWPRHGG